MGLIRVIRVAIPLQLRNDSEKKAPKNRSECEVYSMSEIQFGELLGEVLLQIKARSKRTLAAIQDELGFAVGRESGGNYIDYLRRGHIPGEIAELERLVYALHSSADTCIHACAVRLIRSL